MIVLEVIIQCLFPMQIMVMLLIRLKCFLIIVSD